MPSTTGEPNPILLFFLLLALILGVIGLMAFISRAKAWLNGESFFTHARLRGVRDNGPTSPTVMSRPESAAPPSAPSSLRTDGGRTETTAPQPKFTEDQLLTLYTGLRAHGMVRDKASQLLKASGIPMNNNLWAKAGVSLPPEDDEYRTPIAGRPANAADFREAGDLAYEPPPK